MKGRLLRLFLATAILALVVAFALRMKAETPAAPPQIDAARLPPRISRSIDDARGAVLDAPASGVAWGRLGIVYLAHDYRSQALTCLARAAKLQPREFDWPYFSAIAFEDSDLIEAEKSYAAAAALETDYAPLYWRYGNLLLRQDRLDESEREFQMAARLDAKSPYPSLGLGRVELARGRAAAAADRFAAATAQAPLWRGAHAELAGALERLGKTTQARKVREEAARLPPASAEMPDPVWHRAFENVLGTRALAIQADELVARGEGAKAALVLRNLIRECPDLSRPRISLGQLLQARGDLAGAVTVYREAAGRFPRDPMAQFSLATALEALGQGDEAVPAYRRAGELKPDYAEAHYRLGLALRRQGDAEGAVRALTRAIAADAALAPAQFELGVILRDRGDVPAAVHHLRLAVRLAPDDREAARCLTALIETGRRTADDDAH